MSIWFCINVLLFTIAVWLDFPIENKHIAGLIISGVFYLEYIIKDKNN